jgi:hypothetical protein
MEIRQIIAWVAERAVVHRRSLGVLGAVLTFLTFLWKVLLSTARRTGDWGDLNAVGDWMHEHPMITSLIFAGLAVVAFFWSAHMAVKDVRRERALIEASNEKTREQVGLLADIALVERTLDRYRDFVGHEAAHYQQLIACACGPDFGEGPTVGNFDDAVRVWRQDVKDVIDTFNWGLGDDPERKLQSVNDYELKEAKPPDGNKLNKERTDRLLEIQIQRKPFLERLHEDENAMRLKGQTASRNLVGLGAERVK